MRTEQDEIVQELLSDVGNDEAYCLTDEDAAALNNVGYATEAGQWIVIHIDDYSQSHWIADNLEFFNTEDEAQEYVDMLLSGDTYE